MSTERPGEAEYLATYDPSGYPSVAVTVDVALLTIRDRRLHVLLVERAEHPYQGHWALPGGFVGTETLGAAAARKLAEETGLRDPDAHGIHLEQLGTYGDPGRDPRMQVVSVAYVAFAPDLPEAVVGSAGRARYVPVDDLGLPEELRDRDRIEQAPGTSTKLAFDHAQILADALERCRSKLEYTPLATAFVGTEFTISELRGVYEAVWGEQLHAGNFHRKVLSVPGFVESAGTTTERGGSKGGPRARLYRRGDARLLHPALLRPAREDEVR